MIVHCAPPSSRHAPATASEPARRLPLYLYGRNKTRVGVDGPALLVQRANKSPARYPLARLSRVISGASVEWTAAALALCLEHELPIVFLDRAGEPAGYLHPVQAKPSRLDALIRELLARPDGMTQYAQWLRAERMRVLRLWRQVQEAAGGSVASEDYRELARRHVYAGEPALLGLAGERLYQSAVHAYALEQVQRAGLRVIYWAHDGLPLLLAADLAGLLALALMLELRGLGGAVQGDDAALLRVLHSYGRSLAERCERIFASLHRRLSELLDEWR